jgi:hypothetical protein
VVGAAHVAGQQAGQAQPQAGQREHVVKRGDTLWGLARFYFTNPFLWPVIFEANRAVIEDPHWIYPDEKLRIPSVENGLPVVVQGQQPGQQPQAQPQPQMQEPVRGPAENASPGSRSRFYTPPPPVDEGRATSLKLTREPLYVVPLAEYYSAPWLADSLSTGIRGRLMGTADPATQHDKLPAYLHPFDRILFGWLQGEPVQVGDSMLVVRFGKRIGLHGDMVMPVALVRIDSVNATTVSAKVMNQYGSARTGDHLIPLGAMPSILRGHPEQVSDGPEGMLLAFVETEQLHGTMDVGFIDMGADKGVGIGDELLVYLPARRGMQKSVQLPSEAVATLRVVKVGETTSTVRVVDASHTVLQGGLPVRVVRKMP